MALAVLRWSSLLMTKATGCLTTFPWNPSSLLFPFSIRLQSTRRVEIQKRQLHKQSQTLLTPTPQIGVACCVFDIDSICSKEPHILLIQRGTAPAKGKWSFPGGRLQVGETLAECARREVLEETGVKIHHLGGVFTLLDAILTTDGVNLADRKSKESFEYIISETTMDGINCDHGGAIKVDQEASNCELSNSSISHHYVLVDFIAYAKRDDMHDCAGDDAVNMKWLPANEAAQLVPCIDMVAKAIKKAIAMEPSFRPHNL
eukprot:m.617 g.617  ORF g.617 m.617 type:complete len:260 (-) comp433_c0_seq1:223-1002(-)